MTPFDEAEEDGMDTTEAQPAVQDRAEIAGWVPAIGGAAVAAVVIAVAAATVWEPLWRLMPPLVYGWLTAAPMLTVVMVAFGSGAYLAAAPASPTDRARGAIAGAAGSGIVGSVLFLLVGSPRAFAAATLALVVVAGVTACAIAARARLGVAIGAGVPLALVSGVVAVLLPSGLWFYGEYPLLPTLVTFVLVSVAVAVAGSLAVLPRPAARATTGSFAPSTDATGAPVGASAANRTNPFAVVSLVLGLVGVSLLAVVFGHIALSQIKRSAGAQTGRGMALAGTIFGWLGLAAVAAAVAFVVLAPV